MSMIRTFVALEVSKDVRSRTHRMIGRLRQSGAAANWVEPENLHLTLNFLGDVDDRRVNEVCQAAKEVARNHEPFEVKLRGVDAFPRLQAPRVMWAGVEVGGEQVEQLQRELTTAFRDLGFPKERGKFVPHLTIGRLRRGKSANESLRSLLAKHHDFDAGTALIEEMVVFSSLLESGSPIYTPLSRMTLGVESPADSPL